MKTKTGQQTVNARQKNTVILDVCFSVSPRGHKCAQLKMSWDWILEVPRWNETGHQHWTRQWNYTPYNAVKTGPESKYPVRKRNMRERERKKKNLRTNFHIINLGSSEDFFRNTSMVIYIYIYIYCSSQRTSDTVIECMAKFPMFKITVFNAKSCFK